VEAPAMNIFIEREGETRELEFTGTAEQLLEELNINPVTVIVAADLALIPLDTDISGAKRVDILTIVSGG
jgi:sulfur carrier protein ThiS